MLPDLTTLPGVVGKLSIFLAKWGTWVAFALITLWLVGKLKR